MMSYFGLSKITANVSANMFVSKADLSENNMSVILMLHVAGCCQCVSYSCSVDR